MLKGQEQLEGTPNVQDEIVQATKILRVLEHGPYTQNKYL